MPSKRVAGVLAVLVMAAGIASVQPAAAQEVRIRSTFGGGPGDASAVSRRSLDRYSDVLGLSKEQVEQAATIHEGYSSAISQLRKQRQDQISEARRLADEDDPGEMMKAFQAAQQNFTEKSSALEREFFSDLKGILTPDQESRWTAVERTRRREVGLRRQTMSGAGVDLVEVTQGLGLDHEALAPVAPVLEDYETELDAQLQRSSKIQADMPSIGPGRNEIDPEKLQTQMHAMAEASQKVQEVNERSASKIEGVLPDSAKAKFREEVQRRSYPRVYRPSRAARDIEAAMKLSDLSAEQRQRLELLKSQHERDIVPLNQNWARALRDKERSGSGGAVALAGGGVMMMDLGDEPDELKAARTARKEADNRTADQLKSILTPEQREKLPKGPVEGEEEGAMGVGGQMIFRSVEERR